MTRLAVLFAQARVAYGLVAFALPSVAMGGFAGDIIDDERVQALTRYIGGRDVALGLAVLLADGDTRQKLFGVCAACDAGDVVAALVAGDAVPAAGRWGAILMSGPIAAVEIAAALGNVERVDA